jgi:hypothetical protein
MRLRWDINNTWNEDGVYTMTLLPSIVLSSSQTIQWEIRLEWLCWRFRVCRDHGYEDIELWSI